MTKVVVLGAAVMDLVFSVDSLPDWSTRPATQATEFRLNPGGKGLNQAVAAKRYDPSTEVTLLSPVASDEFGQVIRETLTKEGIRLGPGTDHNTSTPVTGVFVNSEGETSFVGWKGIAGGQAAIDIVRSSERVIERADILLLTFEVPLDAVEEALKYLPAERIAVLNPAPPIDARDFRAAQVRRVIGRTSYVVPNRWEASVLLGSGKRPATYSPRQMAMLISQISEKTTVVTCADKGAWVSYNGASSKLFPTVRVGIPSYTAGASDAFCAALGMAEVKSQLRPRMAVELANRVARLAVKSGGGYNGMPRQPEIAAIVAELKRADSH